MMQDDENSTRASYNRVATTYVRQIADELSHKPLERHLLDYFAEMVQGRICDVGCGPGHVAAYLHERGSDVMGVDLAERMVAEAQRIHPTIPFVQADMRQLPFADAFLAGIVAFYSLIHIPPDEMAGVLHEMHRVLQPDGRLFIGFHHGNETRHMDTWWGEDVNLDFRFFTTDAMVDWLMQSGFATQVVITRQPYPEIEVQTERAYIIARKSALPA
jgi:SAM-dependent methyltransferase